MCLAFEEMGEREWPFDLAMLPIGYGCPLVQDCCASSHLELQGVRSLEAFLASPADRMRIFKNVRAKKALAMH